MGFFRSETNLKNFVILKLPEPSTDSFIQKKRKSLLNFLRIAY